MITLPGLIQRILVKDSHLFIDRPEFQTGNTVLDSMLFVARGSQWKRIRKIVTPTLTGHKLRQMRLLIDRCVDSALMRLKRLMQGHELLDLKSFWGLYTADNIAKCFFGTDIVFDGEELTAEKLATKPNEVAAKIQKESIKKSLNKKSSFLRHMLNMVEVPTVSLILFIQLPKTIRNFLGVAFFPKKSIQYFQKMLHQIVHHKGHLHSSDQDFLQYLIERSTLVTDSSSVKLMTLSKAQTVHFGQEDGKLFNDSTRNDEQQEVSKILQQNVRLTEGG